MLDETRNLAHLRLLTSGKLRKAKASCRPDKEGLMISITFSIRIARDEMLWGVNKIVI